MVEIKHGTNSGYRQELKLGIPTCPACRKAHAELIKGYEKGLYPDLPPSPEHGTRNRYNKHLRDRDRPCDPCKNAAKLFMREYRKGKSNELDASSTNNGTHAVDNSLH